MHIRICSHERGLAERLASSGKDRAEIIIAPGRSCEFLGTDGCALGDLRPFQCRLYPLLLIQPASMGIDPGCKFSGEYISRLADPASDAARHFKSMRQEAALLPDEEKQGLCEWSRYVCDIKALPDEDKKPKH